MFALTLGAPHMISRGFLSPIFTVQIFNLSALKHVRSESDPYTLMRMINVNIKNTIKFFIN